MRDKWFFNCCCCRCSSPTELQSDTSTLKCQEKIGPLDVVCQGDILSKSPDDINANWQCQKCSAEISPEKVIEVENLLANLLKDSTRSSFEDVEKVMEELANYLHSNHYLLVLAKRHLIGMYGLNLAEETMEKLYLRESLCKQVNIIIIIK